MYLVDVKNKELFNDKKNLFEVNFSMLKPKNSRLSEILSYERTNDYTEIISNFLTSIKKFGYPTRIRVNDTR